VIREEWTLTADEHRLLQNAWSSAEQLRAFFQTLQPDNSAGSTRYGQAMTRVQAVPDARRARAQMADTGVPPLLWVALADGGLIVLLAAIVCGSPVRKVHITVAAAVGGLVGLVLFLVYQLDFPFSGGISVSPTADEHASDRFTSIRARGASWIWHPWKRRKGPDARGVRALSYKDCPAVTYSPTPSRVQYHRRREA
jgi:hypothetical protein